MESKLRISMGSVRSTFLPLPADRRFGSPEESGWRTHLRGRPMENGLLSMTFNQANQDSHWFKARVGVAGGAQPIIIKEEVVQTLQPKWSPQGDWIAFACAEGLCVVSPDGSTSRVVLKQTDLYTCGWSKDGSTLFAL